MREGGLLGEQRPEEGRLLGLLLPLPLPGLAPSLRTGPAAALALAVPAAVVVVRTVLLGLLGRWLFSASKPSSE